MGDNLPELFDRIRALVEDEPRGTSNRLLEQMEHTLTDGYAHALALEGQTIRIERQIGATFKRLKRGDEPEEIGRLTDRLAATERELLRLRTLLDELRRRVDGVRSASPAARG
jgi:Mg2+ and Co2+ transporter CorA